MAEDKAITKQKYRNEMIERGMDFLEQLGIERKDVGKAVLKSFSKGKLDFSNILGEEKKVKETGFEHMATALVRLIPFIVALFFIWLGFRYVTHILIP